MVVFLAFLGIAVWLINIPADLEPSLEDTTTTSDEKALQTKHKKPTKSSSKKASKEVNDSNLTTRFEETDDLDATNSILVLVVDAASNKPVPSATVAVLERNDLSWKATEGKHQHREDAISLFFRVGKLYQASVEGRVRIPTTHKAIMVAGIYESQFGVEYEAGVLYYAQLVGENGVNKRARPQGYGEVEFIDVAPGSYRVQVFSIRDRANPLFETPVFKLAKTDRHDFGHVDVRDKEGKVEINLILPPGYDAAFRAMAYAIDTKTGQKVSWASSMDKKTFVLKIGKAPSTSWSRPRGVGLRQSRM